MNMLAYEQAAVLCRVPGMPIEIVFPDGTEIKGRKIPDGSVADVQDIGPRYVCFGLPRRLKPGAPLGLMQAMVCVAIGVEVHHCNDGVWTEMTGVDFAAIEYKVPS